MFIKTQHKYQLEQMWPAEKTCIHMLCVVICIFLFSLLRLLLSQCDCYIMRMMILLLLLELYWYHDNSVLIFFYCYHLLDFVSSMCFSISAVFLSSVWVMWSTLDQLKNFELKWKGFTPLLTCSESMATCLLDNVILCTILICQWSVVTWILIYLHLGTLNIALFSVLSIVHISLIFV